MMKTERTKVPQFLKDNYKTWGKNYNSRLKNDSDTSFSWHNRQNEIQDALIEMTEDHCSFCDFRPLRVVGPTTDHFRPKKTFPLLAYFWGNLFYACYNCQKRGSQFSKKLLKPDQTSYSFDYYFILIENAAGVFIEPNPARSEEDQERARITRDWFGLNKYGRPEARKQELKDYQQDVQLRENKEKKQCSYRFALK